MTDKPPSYEGDEKVFTLDDVKMFFLRQRKKVLRAAVIGGVLFFAFFLLKAPKYRVEATFKEGIEDKEDGIGLKEFLGGGGALMGGAPQTIVVMKSYQVLKPLVEKLGLNAQVPREGGILLKVYRRVRDNILAEREKPLFDLDSFEFANVHYEGEGHPNFSIQFKDANHFVLFDGQKGGSLHELGEEIQLPELTFTLVKTPKNLKFHRSYTIQFKPWSEVAQALRGQIQIGSGKVNKSIYDLTFHHRDRNLAARIINGLMVEYRNYLKKDHDQTATEQLAYLENRQDQIFRKLDTVFDEHASYLKKNLGENGFGGHKEISLNLLSPYQQMMNKYISIDVELERLNQLEKQERLTAPVDEGPFSRHLSQIMQEITDLKQQRDLLEISLKEKEPFSENRFEKRQGELREVRIRAEEAKKLLREFEKAGEIPQNFSFDPERSLAVWAQELKKNQDDEKEDFAEYLENHIHILSVQEKMLQERFFYGEGKSNQFDGIDLTTVRKLFVEYNNRLDQCEASICQWSQFQKEIDQEDFEISSLSPILSDSLSRKLIEEASQTGLRLKDEKYRSSKEEERWEEERGLQKKILKDHLQQLLKVEELKSNLIQEKIVQLQKVSLDCIHRAISVLSEQANDAIKERRNSLSQEKLLLDQKMKDLREQASVDLPEKWRHEKKLTLKAEIGTKMMEIITGVVETKTISHHLHHVQSKPLDVAILPTIPLKPGLLNIALIGALGSGFGFFFIQLLKQILKGFPTSFHKLRAMQFPVLGTVSAICDGPSSAEGEDLELLRQIGLFLETSPKAKIISLIEGRGPDYSYALAENLARRTIRSLIIRCDFHAKFSAEDQPGLLQIWKGEISELPIRKKEGYDILTSGGFTPYGLEVVQSASFQQLLELLKKKYDALLLVFRSPLNMTESLASLHLCEKAVVTTSGEPTEQLTPFINWAYHEGQKRLTFVVSELR